VWVGGYLSKTTLQQRSRPFQVAPVLITAQDYPRRTCIRTRTLTVVRILRCAAARQIVRRTWRSTRVGKSEELKREGSRQGETASCGNEQGRESTRHRGFLSTRTDMVHPCQIWGEWPGRGVTVSSAAFPQSPDKVQQLGAHRSEKLLDSSTRAKAKKEKEKL
jgi:hypothetical protein